MSETHHARMRLFVAARAAAAAVALAEPVVPVAPAARVVVVGLVVALGALGAACPKAAVCGDGVVDPGETESTCCADAGCSFGACTPASPACAMPWSTTCAAGECAESAVCAGDGAPPRYDCTACGCGDGAACVDDVCQDAATRGFGRDQALVDDDLDLSEYIRLYTDLAQQDKLTLGAVTDEVAAFMQADPRVNTLVYGAASGSDIAVIDDAVEAALTFRPSSRVPFDTPACADLVTAAGASLLPEALVVASVPLDGATRETCPYVGTFASCVWPPAAECVTKASRFAVTFVVLDMKQTLPLLDQAMLVRVARSIPEVEGALLDNAVSNFSTAAGVVRADAGLVVRNRVVAVFHGADPHVYFVIMADPSARPLRLGSFRAVWSDAASQQFLVDNDITSRDCTFTFDGDFVAMHCEGNSGAALDATVDSGNFTITELTTVP